jgi:CarD family transcriptional regulator
MAKANFKKGDYVVYPSHGVGKVTGLNTQELAGVSMDFYQIQFEKEKMSLSVPIARAEKIGLRTLCILDHIDQSLDIITEAAQTSRGIMWSRRAQEYERKINSGDVLAIAEVIRDLHRNVKNPDRSYSERLIYESAYNRFVMEAAHVKGLSLEAFEEEFTSMLKVEEEIVEDEEVTDEFDNDDDIIAA